MFKSSPINLHTVDWRDGVLQDVLPVIGKPDKSTNRSTVWSWESAKLGGTRVVALGVVDGYTALKLKEILFSEGQEVHEAGSAITAKCLHEWSVEGPVQELFHSKVEARTAIPGCVGCGRPAGRTRGGRGGSCRCTGISRCARGGSGCSSGGRRRCRGTGGGGSARGGARGGSTSTSMGGGPCVGNTLLGALRGNSLIDVFRHVRRTDGQSDHVRFVRVRSEDSCESDGTGNPESCPGKE